jgi:hypothetical protein
MFADAVRHDRVMALLVFQPSPDIPRGARGTGYAGIF